MCMLKEFLIIFKIPLISKCVVFFTFFKYITI